MKVRAILEFTLEDENGRPITDRREYVWAAEATDDTIRARLMGAGFLADDTLISSYTLEVQVIEDSTDTASTPPAPNSATLTSDQFDELIDDATHAVNNLIPDRVLAGLSDDERSTLLTELNDALTAVLDHCIKKED